MSGKERAGERERSRRDYRETYGRGGGERFAEEEHPHAYGKPEVADWRRAMRAYVRGHDRGWSADRKYREATEEEPETSRPARKDEPERAEAPDAPSRAAVEASTARTERGTRFGVGVPDREGFTFHRSASTWRVRLPSSERLPRHTDRELDGQHGEGDQA